MGLADVASIPKSDEELKKWAFCHMAAHRDIDRAVQEQFGFGITEYVLDPIIPENNDAWQYQHQQMHNQQNAILGISGNNLLGVDWTKPNILAAWLFLHQTEHLQAATILKLT